MNYFESIDKIKEANKEFENSIELFEKQKKKFKISQEKRNSVGKRFSWNFEEGEIYSVIMPMDSYKSTTRTFLVRDNDFEFLANDLIEGYFKITYFRSNLNNDFKFIDTTYKLESDSFPTVMGNVYNEKGKKVMENVRFNTTDLGLYCSIPNTKVLNKIIRK